jgi:hypothetical protein
LTREKQSWFKLKGNARKITMTDPIMLTASAIATLAFQEFIKSGAGELAKKFTGDAIAKMGQLRELIWNRLRGKHPAAEQALEQAIAGEQEGIDTVATLLGVEMLDREFEGPVRAIAQEINAGRLLDQSSMVQNNYDNARGWQTKVEGGTAYIGEIHISGKGEQS